MGRGGEIRVCTHKHTKAVDPMPGRTGPDLLRAEVAGDLLLLQPPVRLHPASQYQDRGAGESRWNSPSSIRLWAGVARPRER